ncbi:alpha-ketoglutarate-dependent dioxygenase AlkB family protein [Pseudoalteromonas piscicida]|uniref:Alpha-ketoglutarate-dependent dioxygenase AlkB n=1 Tax=Pseudoalteromonas piscicida TaxID=43662 RepID=A0AAD0RII1_PSEO7|nr:alpha-ketoglutarate-dependent dioxygenase AlkB [Pseudoalteromonas piscicida]ASD66158.1 2OG-Fe(II) oxygenase [Pseudoalteromonas piscicida]AXR03136.1 alpha-ketoglutarate-dependent dioxygenase AlkB [Pseudoalteromonas piscicida]
MRAVDKARNLPSGFSYRAQAISFDKSLALYNVLLNTVAWQQNTITLFGKTHQTPRLERFIADPDVRYSYSGKLLENAPWPSVLLGIRQALERRFNIPFNAVLANFYRNGQDSMGWHSDDEPELGLTPTIASLSLGATRKFKIRQKVSHSVTDILLETGSLLIMQGDSQRDYQHALPKQAKVTQGRINLTFRSVGNTR